MNPPDLRRLRELEQRAKVSNFAPELWITRELARASIDALPALLECVEALEHIEAVATLEGNHGNYKILRASRRALARLHHPVEERNDKQT